MQWPPWFWRSQARFGPLIRKDEFRSRLLLKFQPVHHILLIGHSGVLPKLLPTDDAFNAQLCCDRTPPFQSDGGATSRLVTTLYFMALLRRRNPKTSSYITSSIVVYIRILPSPKSEVRTGFKPIQ